MGRKAKPATIVERADDPEPPEGLCKPALDWFAGVVKQRSGRIDPTTHLLMTLGTKWIQSFEDIHQRVRIEQAVNHARRGRVPMEETFRSLTLCTQQIVKLTAELGLTPKSKRYVAKEEVASAKKREQVKTSLDTMTPKTAPTFAENGHANGKHRG